LKESNLMNVRTVGPALMMALGGLIVVAPGGGLANGGAQQTCDTVLLAAVVNPDCCPIDASLGEVDPNACCAPTNEGVLQPCVVDTVQDTTVTTATTVTTVATPTTEAVDSGGNGLPTTGSTDHGNLLIGGLLVLGGGALLVTSRRPKRTA
jgi:LPXTG-motif cell wall-anchored protein